MVIPRTTQEIEEYIRRKDAEAESQGTRTQAEALQMKTIISKAPTKKLVRVYEMLATFSVLLWVLFGDV